MAHGIVIVGLTEGDWLTLTTPATPIEEAKALYRQIKAGDGKVDGVEYDEVRQYTQRGCQRLRFKGKGILEVSVDVKHPVLEADDDFEGEEAGAVKKPLAGKRRNKKAA